MGGLSAFCVFILGPQEHPGKAPGGSRTWSGPVSLGCLSKITSWQEELRNVLVSGGCPCPLCGPGMAEAPCEEGTEAPSPVPGASRAALRRVGNQGWLKWGHLAPSGVPWVAWSGGWVLLDLCKSLRPFQGTQRQQELAEIEVALKKQSKSWFFES